MRKIRKQTCKGHLTYIMPHLATFFSFSFETILFCCLLLFLFWLFHFYFTLYLCILVLSKYLGNINWENAVEFFTVPNTVASLFAGVQEQLAEGKQKKPLLVLPKTLQRKRKKKIAGIVKLFALHPNAKKLNISKTECDIFMKRKSSKPVPQMVHFEKLLFRSGSNLEWLVARKDLSLALK